GDYARMDDALEGGRQVRNLYADLVRGECGEWKQSRRCGRLRRATHGARGRGRCLYRCRDERSGTDDAIGGPAVGLEFVVRRRPELDKIRAVRDPTYMRRSAGAY